MTSPAKRLKIESDTDRYGFASKTVNLIADVSSCPIGSPGAGLDLGRPITHADDINEFWSPGGDLKTSFG